MIANSLRARIAMAVAVVCMSVVSVTAFLLFKASERMEESLVEQIVDEEVTYLVQHYLANPGIVREPGPNIQYYVVQHSVDLQRVPEALRNLPVGNHEIGTGAAEQHVAVRRVSGTRFIVAYDAGQHEIRELKFKQLIGLSLIGVLLSAGFLGYWISGLLTQQLSDLAAKVSGMADKPAHPAFIEAGMTQEVVALASALENFHRRMQTLIDHEKEFTDNASHELRTPLTAIRTSCELLEDDPSLSPKARERIAGIARAATRMTGQIETLLQLARSQSVQPDETIQLAASVEAAMDPWRHELENKGLRFVNRIDADSVVKTNAHAAHLVLTNLLGNAVRHTPQGEICVDWDNNALTVSDTGPGIDESIHGSLFERRFRGNADAEGFGLGLAIVRRACEFQGWHIDIQTLAESGTTFRLRFS